MDEKQVRWTQKAILDKIQILDYWIERNGTKTYSQRLDLLIDRSLSKTAQFPESGKKTNYRNIRAKIVSHYLIFYRIQNDYIEVVRIWDSRRDPKSQKI